MKRIARLLFAALAVLLPLAAATPARADTPRFPVEFGSLVLPGEDYCGFDVLVTAERLNQYYSLRTNPDGSTTVKTTGRAFVTVTNQDTRRTLRLNISGPGSYTYYADGSFSGDVHGLNLLWTTQANSYPGVPALSYTSGHVTFFVQANGLTTDYSLAGRRMDVCAALA